MTDLLSTDLLSHVAGTHQKNPRKYGNGGFDGSFWSKTLRHDNDDCRHPLYVPSLGTGSTRLYTAAVASFTDNNCTQLKFPNDTDDWKHAVRVSNTGEYT